MKQILFILLCVCGISAKAQEPYFAISHTDHQGYEISQVYHVINPFNEQYAIFYRDFESLYAVGFDADHVALGRLQSPFSVRKFQKSLLKTSFGDSHVIVMANGSLKKIAYAAFNFNDRVVNSNALDLDLRDEDYLSSFELNGVPYIMTLHEKLPQISLHQLNPDFTISTKTFDIGGMEFYDIYDKVSRPQKVIDSDWRGFTGINLKPELSFPNTMAQVVSKNKVYIEKGEVLITLDFSRKRTQVLRLNPASGQASLENLPKPLADINDKEVKPKQRVKYSNSYLADGNLAQIVLTPEKIVVSLSDIETGEQLHSFTVNNEESSGIINGGFNQFDSQRFKDKNIEPKQFFNRVKLTERVGILTEKTPNGIVYRIGSWRKGESNNGNYNPFIYGGLLGYALVSLMSGDLAAYSSLANGKTFQAVSAWDEDFNFDASYSDDNSFYEQINEFRKAFPKAGLSLLFRYNKELIMGYYYADDNYIDMVRYKE